MTPRNTTILIMLLAVVSCKKIKLPYITTLPVQEIQGNSASSGGVITGEGISQKGVCWSTSPNPTTDNFKTEDGSGELRYTSSISQLNINTTYFVRAYATNKAGTAYGETIIFQTNFSGAPSGTVSDFEGNIYKTVIINGREWMAENLRSGRYKNGEIIPYVTENLQWMQTQSGNTCYYNHLNSNFVIYGALYNWFAVNDNRGIAPTGWHVPSATEWLQLVNYLGGTAQASNKLRIVGNSYWSTNSSATNESGFSALPGGCRTGGVFNSAASNGRFWTSNVYNSNFAYYYDINTSTMNLQYTYYYDGMSVRCVKD